MITTPVTMEITVDQDWLALVAYGVALRAIIARAESEPWGFSGEEASEMASRALSLYPATRPTREG